MGSRPVRPPEAPVGRRSRDGVWHRTVREVTNSVIDRRAEIGLDVVNNGEQPRVSFNAHVANRLSGIGDPRDAPLWDDLADSPGYAEEAFGTEAIDLTARPSVGDPSRITAAPDYGFDTQAGLAMVHPGIARAKLEAPWTAPRS